MKVVGIGLNKTGTKTLGHYLARWGFRHRTYDSDDVRVSPSHDRYVQGDIDGLLDSMEAYDSFEDWPWPLLYREIDARYPDAKFVLTIRRSPEAWFRSLCNMAVRIGPLPLYEKTVYGSSMPQGRRAEHVRIYEAHNREVEAYFRDRPGKLLTLCWDTGDDAQLLADFLGLADVDASPLHVNRSSRRVYSGDNLLLAHTYRLLYQNARGPLGRVRRLLRGGRRG